MEFIDELEDILHLPIGLRVILIRKGSIYNEKDLVIQISPNGCWEVISHKPDSGGYGQYKKKRTHVLMYEKYQGEIPKGMVVRHECDNPICCNPFHLVIGTQRDNIHDMLERNRCNDYITYELAKEIAEDTSTREEICKKYNVSKDIVNKIKSGKTWKDFEVKKSKKKINKLNEEQVKTIYLSSKKGNEIAREFGISPNTVYDIKHKRIWKKITDKIDKEEF